MIAQSADYGDAPSSYRDASHETASSPDLYLGSVAPDSENGTSGTSPDSTGDDGAGTDDEEAFVALPNVLVAVPNLPGLSLGEKYSVNVPVTNNTGGEATLHGWIDFNKNGKFEEGEYQAVPVNEEESVSLGWDIPVGTSVGDTHARFRLTTDDLGDNQRLLNFFDLASIPILSTLNSTILNLLDGIDGRSVGNAIDGEVEDYGIVIDSNSQGTTIFISGQFINDRNNNGIQDEGELGIDNVTVQLFDPNDQNQQPVATTTTENGGFYKFEDLPSGEYDTELNPPVNNTLELDLTRTPVE